jgi:hypothetical protein
MPFSHFLKDNKPLLNDLDLLCTANLLLLLHDNNLGIPGAVEIVQSSEVVESG